MAYYERYTKTEYVPNNTYFKIPTKNTGTNKSRKDKAYYDAKFAEASMKLDKLLKEYETKLNKTF